MEIGKIIGKNINKLRKTKGLTQQDLANKFNYTANAVSRWERGETIPDIEVLITLANMFGVTIDCLLTENGYEKKGQFLDSDGVRKRKLILSVLVISIFWTIIAIVFIYLYQNKINNAWTCFLWGIPASTLPPMYLYRKEKKPVMTFVLTTIFLWGLLAAIYFQYLKYNLALIFLVGIPAQLSIFFLSRIIDIQH